MRTCDATANGSARRSEQILLNNAVKFTDSGTVRIVGRRDENDDVIAVSDTGIGIREADSGVHFLQKPFSRFELAAKVRETLEDAAKTDA